MDIILSDSGAEFSKDRVFDISPFKETIIVIIEDNDRKDLCIPLVYDVLKEKSSEKREYECLPGNEQTLWNFVHYLEESGQIDQDEENRRSYGRVFDTSPGEQMLFDFEKSQLT